MSQNYRQHCCSINYTFSAAQSFSTHTAWHIYGHLIRLRQGDFSVWEPESLNTSIFTSRYTAAMTANKSRCCGLQLSHNTTSHCRRRWPRKHSRTTGSWHRVYSWELLYEAGTIGRTAADCLFLGPNLQGGLLLFGSRARWQLGFRV